MKQLKEKELKKILKEKNRKMMRMLKQEEQKAKKEHLLLNPNFKNNLIKWERFGSGFKGKFKDKYIFEIKRGILLFQLKIIPKELRDFVKDKKMQTSYNAIEIIKLQEKANKLLQMFLKQ